MNILEYNHSNKKPLSIIVIEMLACSREFGISNSVCTPANRLGFQCTCRKCQTSKSIWYFFSSFKWFFLRLFIYLFIYFQRGEERRRNINVWLPLLHPLLRTWPATQACVLSGNQTGNPLVCRPALNPLSHTNQGISYTVMMIASIP